MWETRTALQWPRYHLGFRRCVGGMTGWMDMWTSGRMDGHLDKGIDGQLGERLDE